jgi:hypothetical protein
MVSQPFLSPIFKIIFGLRNYYIIKIVSNKKNYLEMENKADYPLLLDLQNISMRNTFWVRCFLDIFFRGKISLFFPRRLKLGTHNVFRKKKKNEERRSLKSLFG